MDKAITTAFMVIASVVCAVLVFNVVYPAVIQSSDAMISMKSRVDNRLKSQIEIIHAVQSPDDLDVAWVWVKNVGSLRIAAIESCEVFFGPEGNFSRIPYGTGNGTWTEEVEGGGEWDPTATLKITIDYSSDLLAGERYFVKVVTPNGVSDEYYFSM